MCAYMCILEKRLRSWVVLLTEMNVPGKKNSVTTVIIFIDTVSVFVFLATSFISFVMFSMLSVDTRDSLASVLLL